jgi:hypothetical protein
MAQRHKPLIVALLATWTLWSVVVPSTPTAVAESDELSFSFAGNFGSDAGFRESLRRMGQAQSDFAFAMGGLSYGGMPEEHWCSAFQQSFQNVLVLAGSSETGQNATTGSINEFVRHCRYPLDVPLYGEYGKEYYFDYPFVDPIARFVLLSPALRFVVDGGEIYDYGRFTPRYYWVRGVIDDAREAGIPWVIVGMHKNCIAADQDACEIGTDLFNLLLDRKVDLILQAHTHHYERSKQLRVSEACSGIVVRKFNPGCVVDDGADGQYDPGVGTALVIAGTGGRDLSPINVSNPYVGYFAAWPEDPSALGHGVVTFHISRDHITMETDFNGTYRDSLTLAHRPPAAFIQTILPALPFIAPVAVAIEMFALNILVTALPRKGTKTWRRSRKTTEGRTGVRGAVSQGRTRGNRP